MRTLGEVLSDKLPIMLAPSSPSLDEQKLEGLAMRALKSSGMLDWPVPGPLPEGQCYVVPRERWELFVCEYINTAGRTKEEAISQWGIDEHEWQRAEVHCKKLAAALLGPGVEVASAVGTVCLSMCDCYKGEIWVALGSGKETRAKDGDRVALLGPEGK